MGHAAPMLIQGDTVLSSTGSASGLPGKLRDDELWWLGCMGAETVRPEIWLQAQCCTESSAVIESCAHFWVSVKSFPCSAWTLISSCSLQKAGDRYQVAVRTEFSP